MKPALVMFYLFAAFSLASALVVVLARSPMRCAIALMCTFLGIAGVYGVLHAQLLAVIQVLVYAGGVTALFGFVIMTMRQGQQVRYPGPFMPVRVLSLLTAGYLVYLVGPVLLEATRVAGQLPAGYGAARLVGRLLFSTYLVPFEAVGILLVMTTVAVISLTTRERRPGKEEGAP